MHTIHLGAGGLVKYDGAVIGERRLVRVKFTKEPEHNGQAPEVWVGAIEAVTVFTNPSELNEIRLSALPGEEPPEWATCLMRSLEAYLNIDGDDDGEEVPNLVLVEV